MDPLVTAALVGTGQRAATEVATAPEVDTLITGLPQGDAERALLLRAGAWAVYKQAGALPEAAVEVPAPAPEEQLPACSAEATNLLRRVTEGTLLIEALDRMRRAKLRLPFDVLPAMLDLHPAEQRAAVAPVLGERGRWLARHNKAWAWVAQTVGDTSDGMPDDAETIWQEGTAGQRVEILRRLRAVDAAKGREWLEPVWKREKAELRADLLNALEVGLGVDDEALLEAALDDKAERPRTIAHVLLLRIPSSKLMARMQERAAAMLVYAGGKLDAKPPTAVDPQWLRDGLTEKTSSTSGQREFWLRQVLCRVAPSQWEQRYGAAPAALLTATEGSKWRIAIVESWTDAAERFGEAGSPTGGFAWCRPLWDFWRAATDKDIKQARGSRGGLLTQVLPLAAEADREAWALDAIADASATSEPSLDGVLGALPQPWSEAVGTAYIAGLRSFATSLTAQSKSAEPWDDTLEAAGLALPVACFAAALEPLETPESGNWYLQNFRRALDRLADVLRTRQRIYEEIPL
jgi:hypothetical protein